MWELLLILVLARSQTIVKIGPQTTFISEPLDARGFIDYPQALNERLRIPPQRNANREIWLAMGPQPEGAKMPADYFRWLGIERPPEKGRHYFQDWLTFARQNQALLPRDITALADDPAQWEKDCLDRIQKACREPWKASEHPDLARWLKENEEPLAHLIEAGRAPEYFQPLTSTKESDGMRLLSADQGVSPKARRWSEALICRAMGKMAEGQLESAWDDLRTCRRLGNLIASQSATVLEMVTGLGLMERAVQAQGVLLNQKRLTPKQLRSWMLDVQKMYTVLALAAKCDLGERFIALDAIQSMAISEWKLNGPLMSIDFNQALLRANHFYDRYVPLVQEKDRHKRKEGLESLFAEMEDLKETAGIRADLPPLTPMEMGSRLGHETVLMLAPALEKIAQHIERVDQQQRNLEVAFALALYYADQGAYPTRLTDLVPKYLAKLPDDRFSGKSLIYKSSKTGYLLYSVGINEQDDGGQGEDDEPKGDDLRIRIGISTVRK